MQKCHCKCNFFFANNLSQIYKYKDIKSLKFMGQRVPGAFQEAQPHPP